MDKMQPICIYVWLYVESCILGKWLQRFKPWCTSPVKVVQCEALGDSPLYFLSGGILDESLDESCSPGMGFGLDI